MSLLDHQIHQLSESARKRLQNEAAELTRRRAELLAEQGSEKGGDLVDQAWFATQQMEIENIDRRLARIEELLSATTVVSDAPEDTVAVGSVVTLRFNDGSTETYQVGLIEEQDGDVVALTPTSPLGRTLLGHQVGDKVTYDAPAGKMTVEIVEVRAA
ncbi:GreA/GreB family elongation factor [Thermasporomyces composti]|jgi:transcription elongation factor GreA|uniref:Transcription elongation GreA/GreB family factor n=1 Tax=Thermasporomyces composti TaxID=696763 RepID=A0A3D9V4P8_THECX|nr:GreA/GreB family elongation factor [Thermasporomyces composti]REF36718.1 transcription elongation GreA/GreB family factor [Thermasporomyces composti]